MRTVRLGDGTTQDVHDGQARTLVRLGQATYADERPGDQPQQPATPYPPPQIPGTPVPGTTDAPAPQPAPGTTDTPAQKPAAARKRSTKVPGARRVVRRGR